MSEELNVLLQSTSDEGPRPEFVAGLREDLLDELAREYDAPSDVPAVGTDAVEVNDLVVELDRVANGPFDHRSPMRWLPFAAAVIGMALVAWLLISLNQNDSEVDTFDIPEDVPSTTIEAAGTADEPIPLGFVDTGEFLSPGSYVSNALGSAVVFETAEGVNALERNGRGILSFTDLTTQQRIDRTLTFRRLSSLPDPAEPVSELDDASWPVDEFDAWLTALGEGAVVEGLIETTVGGFDAQRVQISVGEVGCGLPTGCPSGALHTVEATDALFIEGGIHLVWLVDQSDQDPLLIVSIVADPDDLNWFEASETFVESVSISDVGPNPLRLLPSGTAEFGVLGGLVADVPTDFTKVFDDRAAGVVIAPDEIDGFVSLISNPISTEGETLATAEDVLNAFEQLGLEWVENESLLVDGVAARSFTVASQNIAQPALGSQAGEERLERSGWIPFDGSRVWLIEHPEREVLFVGTSANGTSALESLEIWAEQLLSSLVFANQ